MATAAVNAVSGVKAGFWIRFVAILIDSILLGIVSSIINVAFSGSTSARTGVQLILGIVYYTYFWSNSSPWPGQTLGSKALNIKVIRTEGSDLTITQALIRYVGFVISSIPLGLGLIWAAFDKDKQGWHDKIAGTYVVKAS
ncbi:MAG: RDD family protein [Candidatus Dormibacteraeota bacterium]|nr:RDD family protein [Candidatus Dormibacteraeota bacterium]